MYIKAIMILSAMIVAGTIMMGPARGDNIRAELEAIVDNYIAACEAKSPMLDSSSENIRRSAMQACLRATFCRKSKTELIDELVANNVAPKEHTVHHYLNARFNEIVGAGNMALK